MEKSIFSNLVQVRNVRESSGTLIRLFCRLYHPENKNFVLNNRGVTFRFCAEEVAHVLSIKNTGTDLVNTKGKEFPQFLFDLCNKYPPKKKAPTTTIITSMIKSVLNQMLVNDEESKFRFKQLLCYYLIEKILMCSANPKAPRMSFWGIVENLEALEQVNWAKQIFDYTCEAISDLKSRTPNVVQNQFKGCAPALETIIYERIQPLRPQLQRDNSYPPVQKYYSLRQTKDYFEGILEKLEASEIIKCQWCGDGVEGDASLSTPSTPSLMAEEEYDRVLVDIDSMTMTDASSSPVPSQVPPPQPEKASSSSPVPSHVPSQVPPPQPEKTSSSSPVPSQVSPPQPEKAPSSSPVPSQVPPPQPEKAPSSSPMPSQVPPPQPEKVQRRSARPRKANPKYTN
ncbi:uncharacterized protein LOC130733069 isoform X2 [Lotus japonicus]|nr:uncharacterized protein LOC130733069 isoform X2 [Lotus japonicus]